MKPVAVRTDTSVKPTPKVITRNRHVENLTKNQFQTNNKNSNQQHTPLEPTQQINQRCKALIKAVRSPVYFTKSGDEAD